MEDTNELIWILQWSDVRRNFIVGMASFHVISRLSPAKRLCVRLLLFFVPVVPATSIPKVCAVYDGMNKTLQFIESTWNELVC